jgi:hypothetical protein
VLKEVKEGANVLSLLRKHKVTYEDIVHNPNILESKKRVFLSALALDLSRAKPVPVKKRT